MLKLVQTLHVAGRLLVGLILAYSVGTPAPTVAQRLPEIERPVGSLTTQSPTFALALPPPSERASDGRLVLYAAGGLVTGTVAGYMVAMNAGFDTFEGQLGAIVAGPAIAIPLAVHIGNDRRGNYWVSAGLGALIGAAGIVGLHLGSPAGLIAVPILVIPISILAETDGSR
jgi:hypothetical protein